ncbi:MAG: ABC transporter permease [Colwellia sp.]|nr:ABC transporter permease [Colwellia sp.]
MNLFLYQLKQAYLSLKQKPFFIFSIVSTMGITLGALLCVLTLAYVMLLKPLPYPEQEKLVRVDSIISNSENEPMAPAFTYPGLIHLYKNQQVFSESTLITFYNEVITSLPSQPRMTLSSITPEWFDLFAAKMHLGRQFSQTEALNTFNPVAIISYQTWQDDYAGSPDILTQKITVSGKRFQIVGVLAKTFIEPKLTSSQLPTQVFIPWDYNLTANSGRESWFYIDDRRLFIGKLAKSLSTKQLNETLTRLENNIWQEKITGVDLFKGWILAIETKPLKSIIIGDSNKTVLFLLFAVIGLVIIACSNISNLFISHIATRVRQLTIHAAMGATRRDLFKALLAESSLLMLLSMAVAFVIATLGFKILLTYLSAYLPRVSELSLTFSSTIIALFLAIVLAYFFAFISYKTVNFHALNRQLQTGGKGTGIQISKTLRQVLIFSQIVVVTLLVFINSNLFEKAYGVISNSLGFETNNIYRLELSLSSAGESKSNNEISAIIQKIEKELLSLAEVQSISHSDFSFDEGIGSAQVNAATNERLVIETKFVDQHYFQMIEQHLIEGDFFSSAQIKDKSKVVIINDLYAQKLSPDSSALGAKIIFTQGEDPFIVIGIVKAINLPNNSINLMKVYRPTDIGSRLNMLLQFGNGQDLSREQVVNILGQVSSDLFIYSYTSLNKLKSNTLFTQYVTAITSAVLTLLTLLLSAIGLYGILNYATQIRRFEIGTRMAIGAKRWDLIKLIIKDNSSAVLVGIMVSMLLFTVGSIVFNKQLTLYLSWQLLPMFLITLSMVLLISFVACYLPLRQYINKPAMHSLKGSD